MGVVVKKGFKLILTHVLALALALFLAFVFGWLISKWGFAPYSVICSLFYIGLFYSEGWNWGRLEGRKYNEIKESPLRALAASAIPSVICAAFAAAAVFAGAGAYIVNVAVKLWYFPFVGFFAVADSVSAGEILRSGAVIPVVVTIGYYIGTKNFSVLEKIAFRKNRRKEAAKRTK
ncbi:MAG: hypothetical protein LBH54_01555 [Clostridiales bacterium]|jgi:hypothetical protein|nr:hypothetical protein [Clostridiales bacterium]